MSPRPSGTPGMRSRARLHLRRPRGQAAGPRLPQGARGGKRRRFRTVRAKPLLHLVPEEKGKDGSRPGGGGRKRSPILSSPPSSASGRGGAEVKRAGGRAPRRLPQPDEEGGSGGFLPGVGGGRRRQRARGRGAGRSGRHHVSCGNEGASPGTGNGAAGESGGNAGGRTDGRPRRHSRRGEVWRGSPGRQGGNRRGAVYSSNLEEAAGGRRATPVGRGGLPRRSSLCRARRFPASLSAPPPPL